MPIIVNDYVWTQTAKAINIKVPLKDVNHSKVDIFTSDSYIKAHFSPFLLEIFLLNDVDNGKSKCIIKEDLIVLNLIKREESEWITLEKELNKQEKLQMKQLIIEKCQEQAKQESEDRRIKKSQLDRFTVQKAMEIDSVQHAIMDDRREAERKKAMDEFENWKQSNLVKDSAATAEVSKNENSIETGRKGCKIIELPDETSNDREIEISKKPQKRLPKKAVQSEYVNKKKEECSKRVLPKLRTSSEIEIKFTPRTFPTPSRESTAQEEEQWLKNITIARRATGFVSEDLRPEEQDPQWCKEKGDDFFKKGNFLGAISAYTHGITLSDKLPTLYANRAATHFALGNFNKCANDCTAALDLMKPACEGNRHSRAKCIARRGAALARLGYLHKGIGEMKAASKLLPDDEGIKQDIFNMERAWEQNPDSE